jgi:nibrin
VLVLLNHFFTRLLTCVVLCVHRLIYKGPSCKVGRSIENSVVFATDKSISRVHAEIIVEPTTGCLQLVDLESRYGTSVDGTKLAPNSPITITHGMIVRFGVGTARVRFVKKVYSFCSTRLERVDKDRLKRLTKLMNAKITTKLEGATHVVTNSAAATLKTLAAVTIPLKLITVDWLGFMDGSRSWELIPSESE